MNHVHVFYSLIEFQQFDTLFFQFFKKMFFKEKWMTK